MKTKIMRPLVLSVIAVSLTLELQAQALEASAFIPLPGTEKSVVQISPSEAQGVFTQALQKSYEDQESLKIWGWELQGSSELEKWESIADSQGVLPLYQEGKLRGLHLYTSKAWVEYVEQGINKKIEFLWNPPANRVVHIGCAADMPRLLSSSSELNFFVYFTCSQYQNKNYITLAYPPGVEVKNSSLFEQKGKGELFKHYEVPAGKPGRIIGQFVLRYQEKDYNFTLVLPKDKGASITKSQSLNTLMLGTGQLNIESANFSRNDSKYTLVYEYEAPLNISKLFWGGHFSQSFAMGPGSESGDLSRTYINTHLAYRYDLNSQWILYGGLYFSIFDFKESVSGFGFNSLQLGYGGGVDYAVAKNQKIRFQLAKISMGASALSDHLSYGLFYDYQTISGGRWGIGMSQNTFNAVSASGLTRILSFQDLLLRFGF